MKKLLLGLFFSIPLITSAQITQGDGLRMPGDWNGFINSLGMGGDFDLTLNTDGTRRWETTFQYTGTTGAQNFKFASGGGDPWANQWAGISGVSMNTVTGFTWTNGGGIPHTSNNTISVTNGNYYKVIWKDNGYSNTDAIFMELSQAPVSIIAASAPAAVGLSQDAIISVTLSGSLATEEMVFLVILLL